MNKIKTLILAGTLALMAPAVHAQIAPATEITLSGSISTLGANTTGTYTSQAFSPNSLTGFAVVPNITISGGTANMTFNFQPSLDGVNIATIAPPLSYVMPVSGTSANVGFYSFAPSISGSAANNIPYWRLFTITNSGTDTVTINAITITKTNR